MENNFTRLTLEQNDIKVVWEVPNVDVTGEDMMQAIRTIMIGMTFHENTIENSMKNYLEERGYHIVEETGEDARIDDDRNCKQWIGR